MRCLIKKQPVTQLCPNDENEINGKLVNLFMIWFNLNTHSYIPLPFITAPMIQIFWNAHNFFNKPFNFPFWGFVWSPLLGSPSLSHVPPTSLPIIHNPGGSKVPSPQWEHDQGPSAEGLNEPTVHRFNYSLPYISGEICCCCCCYFLLESSPLDSKFLRAI